MTFFIVYQTKDLNRVEQIYKMVDEVFRNACATFRYQMKWYAGKCNVPTAPMEQAVTEYDVIVVERLFRLRGNERDSASLFFAISSMLERSNNISIDIELETEYVVSKGSRQL